MGKPLWSRQWLLPSYWERAWACGTHQPQNNCWLQEVQSKVGMCPFVLENANGFLGTECRRRITWRCKGMKTDAGNRPGGLWRVTDMPGPWLCWCFHAIFMCQGLPSNRTLIKEILSLPINKPTWKKCLFRVHFRVQYLNWSHQNMENP